MRPRMFSILSICLVARVGSAQTQRSDTLFVSSNYIVDTATAGVELIATFDSAAARTAMLRLDAPVATLGGKRWVLGDILVSLDINGAGYVAKWTVAGPAGVIGAYVAAFRALVRSRHPIYDYGVRKLVVRCACD